VIVLHPICASDNFKIRFKLARGGPFLLGGATKWFRSISFHHLLCRIGNQWIQYLFHVGAVFGVLDSCRKTTMASLSLFLLVWKWNLLKRFVNIGKKSERSFQRWIGPCSSTARALSVSSSSRRMAREERFAPQVTNLCRQGDWIGRWRRQRCQSHGARARRAEPESCGCRVLAVEYRCTQALAIPCFLPAIIDCN
jgi:hypothetical protein